MARWRFDDPTDGSSYTFEMSPKEGGSPGYTKKVESQTTAAPDGSVILMEGRDEVRELEFNGIIRTEAHYTAMVTWFTKRHAIELTDDLDRVFRIYITEFRPTRKRAATAPWKHDYSVRATVIS